MRRGRDTDFRSYLVGCCAPHTAGSPMKRAARRLPRPRQTEGAAGLPQDARARPRRAAVGQRPRRARRSGAEREAKRGALGLAGAPPRRDTARPSGLWARPVSQASAPTGARVVTRASQQRKPRSPRAERRSDIDEPLGRPWAGAPRGRPARRAPRRGRARAQHRSGARQTCEPDSRGPWRLLPPPSPDAWLGLALGPPRASSGASPSRSPFRVGAELHDYSRVLLGVTRGGSGVSSVNSFAARGATRRLGTAARARALQ